MSDLVVGSFQKPIYEYDTWIGSIFVYIATAVVVLIVLAGGRDHADGIRN